MKSKLNNTKKIADHYDSRYAKKKNVFGTQPFPLVRKVIDEMKAGDVIEFGSGEGRNSLFLASKGFKVTAVDISAVAIERLEQTARAKKYDLTTIVEDISSFRFTKMYDVIVCTFTLHHLSREQALRFISRIKEHTNPGGLNVITAFTKDGDFYREDPATSDFYLDQYELKDLYSNWTLDTYYEKKGEAVATHPDGTHMTNVYAGMIARK